MCRQELISVQVVIIGNGIAGNVAAFALRQYDKQCKIAIVSGEDSLHYDPCSLPYYVGRDVPRETVFRKTRKDYETGHIDLILGQRAEHIEPSKKTVTTDKGNELRYDKLILAMGAGLTMPSIEGVHKKGVFSCNILSDADDLAAHEGKAVVVIGSGLIGVEVAEALKKNGYQVHIIELLDRVMPRLFDEKPASLLERDLNAYGIQVLTGERVLSIGGDSKVSGVVTDKREIQCDTVVIATGVVPSKEPAESAGIEVSRGIKVDGRMMTSVENIYACGDCVETVDAITGEPVLYLQKHNAIEQAEVVARNCLGDCCEYTGAWNFARAHFFDTYAVSIGKRSEAVGAAGDIEIIERTYGRDYLRLILKEGKLAGVQAIGKFADHVGVLLGAMWRQDDLSNLRSNWDEVLRLNYAAPWPHRIIGQLMGLSSLGRGVDN
jgi:NADH oxidase (H2O2-forming)